MSANDAPCTFCQWQIPAPAGGEVRRLRFRSKRLPHYATCTSPDWGAHAASWTVKRRRGRAAFSRNLSRSLKDFLLDASLILHRAEHLLNAYYWAGCGRQGRREMRNCGRTHSKCQTRAQKVIVVCCKHRLWIRVRAHFVSQPQHRKPGVWIAVIRGSFFRDALLVNRYFTSSWSPSRTFWDRDPFGEGCWRQES